MQNVLVSGNVGVNSLSPVSCRSNFKKITFSLYKIVVGAVTVKLLTGECYGTSVMSCQHDTVNIGSDNGLVT